jgi:predicted AAA+ superfamily ATPase
MKRIQSQYLFEPEINADKIIFLTGPHQIGKTAFVRHQLEKLKQDNFYVISAARFLCLVG